MTIDTMTADNAAAVSRRGRVLLRHGKLTHHEFALLDTLLWGSRARGQAVARATYSQLQHRAHQARATVAKGIVKLVAMKLIQRIKNRVLIIGVNGGRVWRQLPNAYRMMTGEGAVSREFTARTDSQVQESFQVIQQAPGVAMAAQEALRLVRERRQAARDALWRQRVRK